MFFPVQRISASLNTNAVLMEKFGRRRTVGREGQPRVDPGPTMCPDEGSDPTVPPHLAPTWPRG